MGKEKQVASVTGTTAIIKRMLSHKVSPKKIVETLIPMFTEKGISEALAKRRIRPLIYREHKKREANKKNKIARVRGGI
jgi:hypothetical protein